LLRDRNWGAAIALALFWVLGVSAQARATARAQSNSATSASNPSQGVGIALVQSASTDASNSNWAGLAFNSNNAAGNFIAVVIQGGQPGEVFNVTDTQGNTYLQAIQTNEATGGNTIAIYYAMNIAGGANTVNVHQTILDSFRFAILEYSGVAQTNALDVAAAEQGASASPNSGSVTTTANGDLLLGGILTDGGESYTAGSSYTIEQSVSASPNTKLVAEDRVQAAAGTSSAGATLSGTDFWAAVLAGFKAGATGSSTGSSGGGSLSGSHGQLSATRMALSFGNVGMGSNSSQTVTLSNSGTANVTISNVSISGAGIAASGIYVGLVLTPGQQAPLNVIFAPAVAGGVTGSITVTSNATNSSMSIAVSGAGVQLAAHSVGLTWTASTGAVGYNLYRGTVSGGPYSLVTGTPISTTSFTDTNVQSGQTYYYVVTSLNSSGAESTFSSPASATIP